MPNPSAQRILGTSVGIAVDTMAWNYEQGQLHEIAHYDGKDGNWLQIDLRGADIHGLDLRERLADLYMSTFDSKTIWGDLIPVDFDPELILENGKNPGLNVRVLHEMGIDGRGVALGIIDQPLLNSHVEYKAQLKHYEQIFIDENVASMHGAMVASIAVGDTVGVSPKADLYYIAAENFKNPVARFLKRQTYQYYAEALNRLLDLNEQLPEEKRICAVSISWNTGSAFEFMPMQKALQRAKDQNVFVISCSLERDYGFAFAGLGKKPLGDPDDIASYSVGLFHRSHVEKHYQGYEDSIFFPMDGRTYASFQGSTEYTWSAGSGWSAVVPYIAGLYVLCKQVNADITPEQFWEKAKETSVSLTVENMNQYYTIKHVINPVELVLAVQQNNI